MIELKVGEEEIPSKAQTQLDEARRRRDQYRLENRQLQQEIDALNAELSKVRGQLRGLEEWVDTFLQTYDETRTQGEKP